MEAQERNDVSPLSVSLWGKGTMAQGYEGAMVEWHKGIMAQWGKGTPVAGRAKQAHGGVGCSV